MKLPIVKITRLKKKKNPPAVSVKLDWDLSFQVETLSKITTNIMIKIFITIEALCYVFLVWLESEKLAWLVISIISNTFFLFNMQLFWSQQRHPCICWVSCCWFFFLNLSDLYFTFDGKSLQGQRFGKALRFLCNLTNWSWRKRKKRGWKGKERLLLWRCHWEQEVAYFSDVPHWRMWR